MWAFDFCNNVVRFQNWILKRKRFIPRGKASKGERAVAAALDKHGFLYETQYEFLKAACMMEYPIVLLPSEETSNHFSVSTSKKNKKIGASELVAFSHIMALGLECIREDVTVVIEGHRYEPDLVYMDKEQG